MSHVFLHWLAMHSFCVCVCLCVEDREISLCPGLSFDHPPDPLWWLTALLSNRGESVRPPAVAAICLAVEFGWKCFNVCFSTCHMKLLPSRHALYIHEARLWTCPSVHPCQVLWLPNSVFSSSSTQWQQLCPLLSTEMASAFHTPGGFGSIRQSQLISNEQHFVVKSRFHAVTAQCTGSNLKRNVSKIIRQRRPRHTALTDSASCYHLC